MQGTIPELKMLLSRVENNFGRTVATSTDFEALSQSIENKTGQMLSSSTLKRLWGYVTSNPVPRLSTLDILAQYLDMRSFREFCNEVVANADFQSNFFSTKCIFSSQLEVGTYVTLTWNPDRVVTLQFLGDCRFKVKTNVNSHLESGDEFEVSTIMLGYPLFLASVLRNGEIMPAYVAGSRDGITGIEIV